MTFQEVAELCLKDSAIFCRDVTIRGYRCVLEKHVFPVIGPKPIDEITRLELRAFMGALLEKKYRRGTLLFIARVMGRVFRFGVENGLCRGNPAAGLQALVKRAKAGEEPKAKALKEGEIGRFRAAIGKDSEFALLFRLMLSTGIRIGEAAALRWEDFYEAPTPGPDGKPIPTWHLRVTRTRTVTGFGELVDGAWVQSTTKGRKPRAIPLGPTAQAALEGLRRRRQGPWLIRGEKGRPWSLSTIRRRFRELVREIGPYTPHAMRHTFGSLLIREGVDPPTAAGLLGHSDPSFTLRFYGSHLPDFKRAIDKMAQIGL